MLEWGIAVNQGYKEGSISNKYCVSFILAKEDENTMTGLTKDCRDRLHKSAMLLDSIRDSLVSGDISLSQLEVILKHQEKFAAIASIDPKCCMSKDVMFEILQRRREQLDSVKVNKQHTKDLQVMCSHLSLGKLYTCYRRNTLLYTLLQCYRCT